MAKRIIASIAAVCIMFSCNINVSAGGKLAKSSLLEESGFMQILELTRAVADLFRQAGPVQENALIDIKKRLSAYLKWNQTEYVSLAYNPVRKELFIYNRNIIVQIYTGTCPQLSANPNETKTMGKIKMKNYGLTRELLDEINNMDRLVSLPAEKERDIMLSLAITGSLFHFPSSLSNIIEQGGAQRMVDLLMYEGRILKIGNMYHSNTGRSGKSTDYTMETLAGKIAEKTRRRGRTVLSVSGNHISLSQQIPGTNLVEDMSMEMPFSAQVLQQARMARIKGKKGAAAEEWASVFERAVTINRRMCMDPYAGSMFAAWRAEEAGRLKKAHTIVFTLEALEDNIYDEAAVDIIRNITAGNIRIYIAAQDKEDAEERLRMVNFPVDLIDDEKIRFVLYTNSPSLPAMGLSPAAAAAVYNEKQEITDIEGYRAVKVSHGVTFPQAVTFAAGMLNRPLRDTVEMIKDKMRSYGYTRYEIESIVKVDAQKGIIFALPKIREITDKIQEDNSIAILASA